MLTVRQFLSLPLCREFKIVAGEKGLDNVISSINIMDNPDALDWFSPGEMLLTSGYFFKDSPELQNRIVRQLRSLNSPALCIKPRRYLGTIPQNIILLAEMLNLPVIELPYGISFSKITSLVMEKISEKYDVLTRRSLDIHEEFFKISLRGGGLAQICSSLAAMINNPVVLLDRYWNILHWTELPNNPFPLAEYINLKINTPFVDWAFLQRLPLEFENLQKPIERHIEVNGNNIDCVIMPVQITNVHHGYILVWKTFRNLTDIDYIALEHGTMSFAMERIRYNELERTRNRVRRDFFDELLSGNIHTKDNLNYLCNLHGMNPNLWYTPMVFHVDFKDVDENKDLITKKRIEDERMKDILRFMEDYAVVKNFVIHCFSQNNQIIVLFGSKPDPSKTNIQIIRDLATELLTDIETSIEGISLQVGIGRTVRNLLDLSKSFIHAQEALRMAKKSFISKDVCHFDDFVVHNFLEVNISTLEMRRFFNDTLGPLYKYDEKYGSGLIPTLEALISNRFNVAETARSLFTHRNTILYRMERISCILQSDLKDADELLKFQLALKIYRLLDLGK